MDARLLHRAMLGFLMLGISAILVLAPSASYSCAKNLASDTPSDCHNTDPDPDCDPPPPPPPDGGGDPHGAGSEGCNGDCPPAGAEGPGAEGSNEDHGCDECTTPPCNSQVRAASQYDAVFQRHPGTVTPYVSASVPLPRTLQERWVNAEASAGKRILRFKREDIYLRSTGPLPIAIARTYNNWTYQYAANTQGSTVLGPFWHLNYDMRLEAVDGAADLIHRTSMGGTSILYRKSDGYWESNPADSEAVQVQRGTDGNGQTIYTMTGPGSRYSYQFDGTGRLTRLRGPNGCLVVLTYADGLLTQIDFDNENGDIDTRYLSLEYTTLSTGAVRLYRVRRSWDNGIAVEYQYDTNGQLYRVLNGNGQVVEEYTNTAIPGNSAVKLISEVKARGAGGTLRTTRRYDYTSNQSVTKIYDGAGSTLAEIAGSGNDATAQYYGALTLRGGTTTYFTFNHPRGLLNGAVNVGGGVVRTIAQGFCQDRVGCKNSIMPKTITADDGSTITYEYLSESETGSMGDRTHLKKITWADGLWVEYEYDSNYNVTKVKRPLNRNTSYTYDANGNVYSVTDAMGYSSYYFYDTYGRMTKQDLPTSLTTQWGYDTRSRVTVTTDTEGRARTFEYGSNGKVTTETALGVTTCYAYDSNDRLTTITNALGNKVVYAYDGSGHRTQMTDPMGNTTQYDYTTTGALWRVTDAANGVTSVSRDFFGRATKMWDVQGGLWQTSYDANGRPTTSTDPLGRVTSRTYFTGGCGSCGSVPGLVASVTRPDGNVTSFQYDAAGRLKKALFDGTTDYVELTYDAAGRLTSLFDSRLPSADLGGQTYSVEYDSRDRATTITQPGGAQIVYGYDGAGRRTSMTDPDGNMTTYNYFNQANNRKLHYVGHSLFGGTVSEFEYTSDKGLLSHEYRSNGAGAEFGYDSLNRL